MKKLSNVQELAEKFEKRIARCEWMLQRTQHVRISLERSLGEPSRVVEFLQSGQDNEFTKGSKMLKKTFLGTFQRNRTMLKYLEREASCVNPVGSEDTIRAHSMFFEDK
eukprot:GHVP01029838.1.p1 GENE.GHVP01029838.1~~GHVP01029838.1.p1  ORF type:complete len:109 (+),score=11.98 GHVP01029838.1:447-773(+)